MAEDLIHQAKDDNRQMRDIGFGYFNELLSRCFFQPSSNHKLQFVMHDLINDLAQDVGAKICFNLENEHKISKNIRHLSFVRTPYDVFKKFEACDKLVQLRTFVALPINIHNGRKCYLSAKVFDDLLPKLRQLRVLAFTYYEINELSESIGDLKHLRYLDLSYTPLKWLPETISSLYNLQSLMLCYCRNLNKLPTGIANLINLQYLDIRGSTMLEEMPPRVGNLINLLALPKFFLCKDNGSRIKELKNLLNLRGELAIYGLDNIVDLRDVACVNLKERPSIKNLVMSWSKKFGNTRNESKEMEVLKWLQPHQSLETLVVMFYGGQIFPGWIGHPSYSQVVRLQLGHCEKCTSLPALGRLPLLKHLEIGGMNEIKSIGNEFYGEIAKPFPSLKFLKFENMPEWKDWVISRLVEGSEALFPCLGKLVIIKCPKLSDLPDQLPSLVSLDVIECPVLATSIPRFPSLAYLKINRCNEGMLKRGVVDVPSLTRLFIEEISEPSCLWEGLAQCLTTVEDLGINQCDELACFGKHGCGLENLGGLRRLWILRCDGVVSLEEQGLPCNLRFLEVKGCSNLERLPNALHALTSLTDLVIWNCPKLVSFPETGLPPMLRFLWVENCEGLETLPDEMMINNCALEYLSIKDCPSLIGFPKGELPTTLKKLFIVQCENLESLPEGIMHHASAIHSNNTCHLEQLRVWGCSSLKSIPRGDFPSTLETLKIWKCNQLESIPGKKLQNLTSLRHLDLCNCPDLMSSSLDAFFTPNLKILSISNGKNNVRTPLFSRGLDALTSLKNITIQGPFPNVISFPDNWSQLLPTSLVVLGIVDFYNLKSIASIGLQTLISLEVLRLTDCPKLRSFVPKEGLPPTLGRLEIKMCPILTKRCLKDKGTDWPKIAHIPYLEIDDIVQP